MVTHSLEAWCPSCERDVLIRRDPVYDGFTKVDERHICTSCGQELGENAPTPAPKPNPLDIFKDDVDQEKMDLFSDTERQRCCRYCRHYVINPFTQKCGLHTRDVEATDLCDDFERPPPEEEAEEESPPTDTL